MLAFARTDESLLAKWWWNVDKWIIGPILVIVALGILLNLTATPAYAERIGVLDSYMFVKKLMFFLPVALGLMFALSFQSPRTVRRVALAIFIGALVLTVMTLFLGGETKGAKRWISLCGVQLQPSEFLKPAFAVLSGWLIAISKKEGDNKGVLASFILFSVVALLLLCQPDVGMTATVGVIWGTQFFLSGISFVWVAVLAGVLITLPFILYFIFPHVQVRIDAFLNPEVGDSYQINKAMDAFRSGGLFGKGPGEGLVKGQIPDAHTDFILAVAGEEFGLLLCMLIVTMFAVVIFRSLYDVLKEKNQFFFFACAGLIVQFGFQAIVNISSTLQLMPTKGMTLPFISYGGSSLLASSVGIGMLLALTKKRNDSEDIE